MTKHINEKAVELTDEDIEKTAGGGELTGGTVAKRCGLCFTVYPTTLGKCPSCGVTNYELITVYPKNPNAGGGPR